MKKSTSCLLPLPSNKSQMSKSQVWTASFWQHTDVWKFLKYLYNFPNGSQMWSCIFLVCLAWVTCCHAAIYKYRIVPKVVFLLSQQCIEISFLREKRFLDCTHNQHICSVFHCLLVDRRIEMFSARNACTVGCHSERTWFLINKTCRMVLFLNSATSSDWRPSCRGPNPFLQPFLISVLLKLIVLGGNQNGLVIYWFIYIGKDVKPTDVWALLSI